MADRNRPDRERRDESRHPPHPGGHPTEISSGRSNTTRWIGMVLGALVLVALLWWVFAGTTQQPGQEQTLGEPAGVGVAADPEAQPADEAAAADDEEDPQAAIGPADDAPQN